MSRLPATLPALQRAQGLLREPLSTAMGQAVIDRLSEIQELPESGFVAGQAVMSVVMELFGADPSHRGPINDIDIFHSRLDRFLEAGHLEHAEEAATPWLDTKSVKTEEYTVTFEQRLNLGDVRTDGLLNLIELRGSMLHGMQIGRMKSEEVLDVMLAEFDITTVQVGVDLSTGELRWTQGFQDFIDGGLAQTRAIALAERTWLRVERKREAMPWIQWDDEQIQNAIHLAQVRNCLMLNGSTKKEALYEAWNDRYGAEISARSSNLEAHDASGSRNLKTPRGLYPIWTWGADENTGLESLVRMMGQRRKDGLLPMSTADIAMARLMIRHINKGQEDGFPDQSSALVVNAPDPSEKYFSLLSDPVKLMICSGKHEDFDAYVAANPGCLLEDGLPGKRKPREDLLIAAVASNHLPAANLLMKMGVSPNIIDGKNTVYFSALKEASAGNEKLLDQMRAFGADLSTPLINGSTVAHQVMYYAGNEKIRAEWLKHPIEKRSVRDREGRLPGHQLDLEGRENHGKEVVLELVPMDANEQSMLKLNRSIETAAYANRGVFLSGIEERKKWCDLELLNGALTSGANPNSEIDVMGPALIIFAAHNDADAIGLLLNHGADINIVDDVGSSAFMVAAKNNCLDVMELLYEQGANIHLEDSHGFTALDIAVIQNKPEACSWLIAHGADARRINPRDGAHLLEYATVTNEATIVSTVMNAMPQIEVERILPSIISKFKAKAEDPETAKQGAPRSVAVMEAKMARIAIDKIFSDAGSLNLKPLATLPQSPHPSMP